MMSLSPNTNRTSKEMDHCPHCRVPFEIVCVKFRVPPILILCCPNCALALEEVHRAEPRNARDQLDRTALAPRYLAGSYARGSVNWRFRFTLLFVMAVLVAAMLRHTVHVYGGISPEEMRAAALLLIPIAAVVMMLLRKR
jgi:hypothetical protein